MRSNFSIWNKAPAAHGQFQMEEGAVLKAQVKKRIENKDLL